MHKHDKEKESMQEVLIQGPPVLETNALPSELKTN